MPRPLSSTSPAVVDPADATRASPDSEAGILELYRSLIAATAAVVHRYRLELVTEIALVGLYFVLRTVGVADTILGPWLIAAVVVALMAPTSGLVILAAIAPVNEGVLVSRDIGSKTILALAVLAAVAVRYVVDESARMRPPRPVVLGGLLFVGSGLGLALSRSRWGSDFTTAAAQVWLQGVGTMLIVFAVAVWVARRGELRPLIATIAATSVAGILSLADFVVGAPVRDGPLGWAVVGDPINRLTGVTQSPTATASIVMLPAMLLVAVAVLAPSRVLKAGAALIAAPLVVAMYLTYSRAVFIALFALAVLVGWRVRRRLGVAILVVGLVAAVFLVPAYLAARGAVLGGDSALQPGQVLIATDQQRIGAWAAATRMFLDQPFIGQGYRAYRQLSVQFGDPILNAPHNEWLRFFAEGGIVVGGLALALVWTTVARMARQPHWLVTGILASFASLCIAASFNNPFLFNQVTIPGFLIAGTGVALAERERSLPGGEPAAAVADTVADG